MTTGKDNQCLREEVRITLVSKLVLIIYMCAFVTGVIS